MILSNSSKRSCRRFKRLVNLEHGPSRHNFSLLKWAHAHDCANRALSYVQRLSPTVVTCHSNSIEIIEQQSARLIEQVFTDWATAHSTTSVTVSELSKSLSSRSQQCPDRASSLPSATKKQYQIEPTLRSHTAPLSRGLLLPLLGGVTNRLSSAPTMSSPCPSRPVLRVRADLKNPDLVLLPTVLKNCYALSVVEGNLWKGKKFNLEQIAMDVRRRRGAAEDDEKKQQQAKNEKEEEKEQSKKVEVTTVEQAGTVADTNEVEEQKN